MEKSPNQAGSVPCRTHGVVPERNRDDEVQHHEHEALHPAARQLGSGTGHSLGSAVRQGLVDDEDGQEEHDRFVGCETRVSPFSCMPCFRFRIGRRSRRGQPRHDVTTPLTVKQQGHGLADGPSEQLDHGYDEQRDLDGRADRD